MIMHVKTILWTAAFFVCAAAELLYAEVDCPAFSNILVNSCTFVEQRPAIDGALDDACWKKASACSPFVTPTGADPKFQTQALICHDANNLYLALSCDEPEVSRMKKNVTERDGKAWEDDCVEVFLDTAHNHEDFFHFILTAANVQFDEQRSGGKLSKEWNSAWKSATLSEERKWTAEIGISFATLGCKAPPSGDTWGMNIYRKRQVGREEPSCWSPTHATPHAPLNFGDMVFGKARIGLASISYEEGVVAACFQPLERGEDLNAVKVRAGLLTGQQPAETKVIGLASRPCEIRLPSLENAAGACATFCIVDSSGQNIYNCTYPLARLFLPVYRCHRTAGAIQIDGRLDEPSWTAAASTCPFYNLEGRPCCFPTEAKLLWDNEWLYIGATFKDPKINATRKERDDSLWMEDVFEVFIREQQHKKYHDYFVEYQVSPLGTVMDCFCLGPYAGVINWSSSRWKTAVTIDGTVNDDKDTDNGWTVEMAIPFQDLYSQVWLHPDLKPLTPKNGDRLRMNMIRIEYVDKKPEDAHWSPIYSLDRHDRSRDGIVIFIDQPVGLSRSIRPD